MGPLCIRRDGLDRDYNPNSSGVPGGLGPGLKAIRPRLSASPSKPIARVLPSTPPSAR